MNILIAVLAMASGRWPASPSGPWNSAGRGLLRAPAIGYVQVFRNAPHLVLIFATTYIFPFEIVAFGHYIPFPDWVKAVIGLAIPASAHTAELTRGALMSIPTPQWERRQGARLLADRGPALHHPAAMPAPALPPG